MNCELFYRWYSTLELLPITKEFITTCLNTKNCKNCKLRSGCPIRPIFYMDDLDFEIQLQSSEIRITNLLSNIEENPSSATFLSTQNIREKRDGELKEHPNYSEN